MTKGQINSQINRAYAAIHAGDCLTAQQAMSAAATGFRYFSGWGKTSLRRRVTAAHNAVNAACVQSEGLMTPSPYAAPRAPGYTHPDALMPPNLSGIIPPKDEIGPTIGFVLAAVGLGLGFGSLYKAWK